MPQEKKPGGKPDAREVYAEIIDLPRWEPNSRHPRMSARSRAAQFAPFAALSGYDELLRESMRQTEQQIEPGEEQINLLNRQLNLLRDAAAAGKQPVVTVTYFIPDERKTGGRYAAVTAGVKRIDAANRRMILLADDNPDVPETILLDRILSLHGSLVDSMD